MFNLSKNEVKEFVDTTRRYKKLLDDLEVKAREYESSVDADGVDGNVLFQLELLQGRINSILYSFYLGDLERQYYLGKISLEEKERLIKSPVGKACYGKDGPCFNFGYLSEEFIRTFDYI